MKLFSILDFGFSIWRFKRKKLFCLAIGVLLLVLYVAAEGQQPPKLHRIGFLTNAPFSAVSAGHEAFQQGLRELGYMEGKNIIIECDLVRAIAIVNACSPPNSCVSR